LARDFVSVNDNDYDELDILKRILGSNINDICNRVLKDFETIKLDFEDNEVVDNYKRACKEIVKFNTNIFDNKLLIHYEFTVFLNFLIHLINVLFSSSDNIKLSDLIKKENIDDETLNDNDEDYFDKISLIICINILMEQGLHLIFKTALFKRRDNDLKDVVTFNTKTIEKFKKGLIENKIILESFINYRIQDAVSNKESLKTSLSKLLEIDGAHEFIKTIIGLVKVSKLFSSPTFKETVSDSRLKEILLKLNSHNRKLRFCLKSDIITKADVAADELADVAADAEPDGRTDDGTD